MFPLIDLIATVGGLIVPPAIDFFKKKFIKAENDTPERTAGTLATTKPEVLPEYVNSISGLKDADVRYFNRDVAGNPSQWVVDLRAAIRPLGVSIALLALVGMAIAAVFIPEINMDALVGPRITCEAMVSSWFGHRITISK